MKEKILQIIQQRLSELYDSEKGTRYEVKEFWGGKIEELENLVEKINQL